MPTARTGYLQFYINCAFVNIIGPGGGTPTEFVRFPGTYRDDDPGNKLPSFVSTTENVANPGFRRLSRAGQSGIFGWAGEGGGPEVDGVCSPWSSCVDWVNGYNPWQA